METKTVGQCGQGALKLVFVVLIAAVLILASVQMITRRSECYRPFFTPIFPNKTGGGHPTETVPPTPSTTAAMLLPTLPPFRVSCRKLIEGDPSEQARARTYMASHPRQAPLPEVHASATANCSNYLSTQGYIVSNITDVEKNFSIAFSMLIFKHVSQVERLLRTIYRPQNVYCVHIDSKASPYVRQVMEGMSKCLDNVFIASRSLDVRWGTFTVLEPELVCMRELWKHKVKWRYFINLTGQEYPLKTNYELVRIFQAYNGAADVHATFSGLNQDRVQGRPPAPHGIRPAKGSVHVALPRAFVDFALHDQRALDFTQWLRGVGVPDEMFFNSLYANSQLKVPGSYMGDVDAEAEMKDHLARYKIWYDASLCGGKFAHAICIFGIQDLGKLTSKPHLFANKLHYDFEPLTYDCLERWYRAKVEAEQGGQLSFDTSFYAQRSVVKHSYRPSSY